MLWSFLYIRTCSHQYIKRGCGETCFKIVKRINNNVVFSSDDDGREMILIGKGLGFQAKVGDPIDGNNIEKRYYPEGDVDLEHILMVMTNASDEEIYWIYKIVSLFKEKMDVAFNPNLFLTLTDHILFVMHQQKQDPNLMNPMQWEIKRIYPKEYAIAEEAVDLVRQKLSPNFPQTEVAAITLHFVNAQLDRTANQSAYEQMALTNDIIRIVEFATNIDIAENSVYFQRFVTHIRYYLIRQGQEQDNDDHSVKNDRMVELAFISYPKKKEAADKIKEYLLETKGWQVNDMELLYLILHIGNFVSHSANRKNKIISSYGKILDSLRFGRQDLHFLFY
ncbi:PRD domain-containing protein [Aerococcus urinaeequi]|uniref:PRD domain-containing protein n=1 Tax=Aerococcus urinaeequi TaxID=51665 RepID=UPI0039BC2607